MNEKTVEKKSVNKRRIIAAAMVMILGVGLFVNWYLNSNKTLHTSNNVSGSATSENENLGEAQYVNATTSSYYTESKLKRRQTLDETLDKLNEVINSDKANSEEKKDAVEMYSKLSERANLEADIETLILSKGIKECIVVLGEKTCEVIVNKSDIDEVTALQIKEIVQNKAEIEADKITVSSSK